MDQKISSEISKFPQELVHSLFPVKNLPFEVIRLILSNLSIEELEQLWAINTAWSTLTIAMCLDFYRNAFQESSLWAFLPQNSLGPNIPLLPYFEQFLDKSWLTKLPEKYANLETISSQSISEKILDDLLIGIDRKILVVEEKYLIDQRRASTEITIIDFLKNPPANWLKIARAYRHIETTLNLLLLALFIFADETSFNESIFLILDRRLTHWLTGRGLEELSRHTIQKKILLGHLIDFALGEGELFLKCDIEKQPGYQENAKELLSRLTDDNCCSLVSKSDQGTVLVSAITRHCFPIIDRFGSRSIQRAITENPTDEAMLLVLLERLGVEQLSIALVSIYIEGNFQIIVNKCSRFIVQLLSNLSLEQLHSMVNALTSARFFYLINGLPFLEFLKKLNVESKPKEKSCEKSIISTSANIMSTRFFPRITCGPRTLLLGFVQLKSYYIDEIIKSGCVFYLLPSDILGFLKRFPNLWDILPVNLLDKFTAQELLALAAINLKAVPCIVERGYLESKFTDLKDFVEFVLRYVGQMSTPLQDKCTEAANAHFKIWSGTPGKEDTYTYIHWYILFSNKYPNLLDNITDSWLIQLRGQCQSGTHDTLLKKIGDLQNIKVAKKQIAALKNPDNPIPLSNMAPRGIPKTSTHSPALPPSKQVVSTSEQRKIQETQPIPKNLPQKQENKKQNNNHSLIAMSILKGFFVGVLVTGIAILLMMFINYQMDVPLVEIIDNLWIAGIIGAFAEVVATLCFLADAKVFGSSSVVSANEKPDDSKPFGIPAAQPTADPAYQKPFSPATKTACLSQPPAQQIPEQTPVNNQNGIS